MPVLGSIPGRRRARKEIKVKSDHTPGRFNKKSIRSCCSGLVGRTSLTKEVLLFMMSPSRPYVVAHPCQALVVNSRWIPCGDPRTHDRISDLRIFPDDRPFNWIKKVHQPNMSVTQQFIGHGAHLFRRHAV